MAPPKESPANSSITSEVNTRSRKGKDKFLLQQILSFVREHFHDLLHKQKNKNHRPYPTKILMIPNYRDHRLHLSILSLKPPNPSPKIPRYYLSYTIRSWSSKTNYADMMKQNHIPDNTAPTKSIENHPDYGT
ncbi:hypothetical protein OCU04_004084 [Sclerotinia nivalis]|uniref:Uncharacterized protein n=1 Tax=Sclerotinia nivalis TaxID=352851 RepID=A0A9X0ATC1_9HELO|nr:hypothetical protein OCU04_004084 [Sclerotinia nivalis]